jgi:hypothetical protein
MEYPWSRWVYTHLHHEVFDPAAQSWELDIQSPLSNANGALPWILFSRDCRQFSKEFPDWKLDLVQPIMPLVYLLSGGFATKAALPGWSYPFFRLFEQLIFPLNPYTALFALISLSRTA